ncbi:hypothetical protein [Streptomyces spectabilis]|uniref:Uncharacterized protein n=1 Tax=Streptomyces spectabilis TaxID=68270 RepID=A0A516R216_STRST|nr:hypothetical protein [Streptomyces spectabilis]QDQ09697.1 hypothetical protein FH965_03260 [Streptomyces spectabilis]
MPGQSVRAVVRDVLAEQAPREAKLLDGMASLSDRQITRVFRRSRARRDPLGFGAAEVLALVAPVVWLVVNEVAQRSAATAVDGASRWGGAWLRRVRRLPDPPTEVPALSCGQLGAVHGKVVERAQASGMEAEAAQALADAVVARLATSSGDG